MRGITVVDLVNRADARGGQILLKVSQHILGCLQELLALQVETSLHVVLHHPYPYGTLVVCQVASALIALNATLIERVARRQRTQTLRRCQVLTNYAININTLLCVEHLIIHRASDDLVRADKLINLALYGYIVSQIGIAIQPELLDKRLLNQFGQLLPSGNELLVLIFASQLQGVANCVIPQSIHLDLIALTTRYGLAINYGIHPSHSQRGMTCTHQTVCINCNPLADTATEGLQDLLHLLAIASPNILCADVLLQLLQGPEEPQSCINRVIRLAEVGEQTILDVANLRIQNVQTALNIALRKGQTRQCNEGVATPMTEPGITCDNVGTLTATNDELTSRVAQAAQEIDLIGTTSQLLLKQLVDLLCRRHLLERAREDHAFALCDLTLKVAGSHQVLVCGITATSLLCILKVVVPIGSRNELHSLLVGLHKQPGELCIHTGLNAVLNGIRMTVSIHIGLTYGVVFAESEEGAQTQNGARVSIHESIADQQLRARVNPQHLLTQHNATYTIGNRGGRGVLEVDDVLVASGLIDTREAVQREVERLIVLNYGFVERREQHEAAIRFVDRSNNQTVILTRIAAHDGSTHITALTIGREHLALQRILQVTELVFVKIKY